MATAIEVVFETGNLLIRVALSFLGEIGLALDRYEQPHSQVYDSPDAVYDRTCDEKARSRTAGRNTLWLQGLRKTALESRRIGSCCADQASDPLAFLGFGAKAPGPGTLRRKEVAWK